MSVIIVSIVCCLLRFSVVLWFSKAYKMTEVFLGFISAAKYIMTNELSIDFYCLQNRDFKSHNITGWWSDFSLWVILLLL